MLELEPGLAVLADYGQLVPPSLLDLPHGALNLHPSLLPRHRGATPIPAAILAGDAETGVSLMRMDEGLDTGPIVARSASAADGARNGPGPRGAARRDRGRPAGRHRRGLAAGRDHATGRSRSRAPRLTRRLTREDGRLDPERPAVELERQVRAYQPWPGSFVDTTFGRIAVWSSSPEASSELPNGVFDERGLGVGDGERLGLDRGAAGRRRADDLGGVAARTSRDRRQSCASIGLVTLDERPGISGLTTDELTAWLVERGEPVYRARQIGDAVWRGDARTAADIRTLPAPLREALDAAFSFDTVADTEVREADGGLTEKSLHRLADGALIESVLMHYPARPGSRERHTLCISSQAGCAVGCPFCATGELGFGRDLEVAEIVDQVRSASRRLVAAGQRLTNIVFMGMGEPLLNLDRVLAAIEALNDRRRFGLGARHITVSTSGVVPGIRRLTALGPQFTLAVSLHAARDPLRDVLVPLNRRWPVAEVIAAARDHAAATGRRISYEVTMIGGVNDTELDATAMAELLRGDHAHVNLIPMNPVAHTPWTASPMPVIERFAATLRGAGIETTIRRNRGQEVGAACGQLAAERAGEPPPPVVARRRARLVAESAAALLGERSHEPIPAGVGD